MNLSRGPKALYVPLGRARRKFDVPSRPATFQDANELALSSATNLCARNRA